MRLIEEVAEDLLRTLEELKALPSCRTKSGRIAAGGSCGRPRLEEPPREWDPGGLSCENQWNPRESEGTSGAEEGSRRAKTKSFVTPNPWSPLPREVYVGKGRGKKEGATTESPVDGQDQPRIYTIRDHTLEVLMHPKCARVACRESRPYTAG